MAFRTAYKIDGRWVLTPYNKTKKEAVEEIASPPKLVKATEAKVVRNSDYKIVAEKVYA